ncbi:MAG: hypothetical protein DBP01_09570, partial [gamma proteobacterium symbiont of Ctena orbiculata]
SVNAPFGLETEWPAGTFDAQYPPGTTIPTQSKLEIVAFSPSVAYKINENASLSGGVDYYWMREVIFNGDINAGMPGSNPAADLEGDGRGVGFNLGFMVDQGRWSFGGSYHSEANIPVEGTVELPAGALPSFLTNKVNADLKLPWRLQVGVRNQATDKLAIELCKGGKGRNRYGIVCLAVYGSGSRIDTQVWHNQQQAKFQGTTRMKCHGSGIIGDG